MIKLEHGNLSGMKSELQGFRDLSAFRHFEIGVFGCLNEEVFHTLLFLVTNMQALGEKFSFFFSGNSIRLELS